MFRLRWRSRYLILITIVFGIGQINADPKTFRPNILWITGEDISANWLGCYGNRQIETPNFNNLAKEGFLYTRCHAHVPVCAPARSGWITGIHPVSTGTIYMRSQYEIPKPLMWYPDFLRANGYFTANHHKTDYNTSNRRAPGPGGGANEGSCGHYTDTWDSYCNEGWNEPNRRPDHPFFQVVNAAGCHESHLHRNKNELEGVDPAKMKLAAYHPDIPEVRKDYARVTAGVMAADKALGRILARLKKNGLTDDTIVIYTSDHGGIIGRSKRFLYDSGTHAAFIIRIPKKFKHLWPADSPGARIDRLVSFIDMPKTWLAITGSTIPKEMQGHVFLGDQQDPPRECLFMARERMDEVPDMQRAMRDGRYLYIRSYEPFRLDGQYLEYLWQAPSMPAWEAWHNEGKTDAITGAFFRPRSVELLFDCERDPDNVRNLAAEPTHAQRLANMREGLKQQQMIHHDCGFLPEGILAHRAKQHKTTIYEMIRNSGLYDQQDYMKAADLANFAKPADLPELIELLESKDEGRRFWGVNGCITLGKQAATPEVLAIMEKLIMTDTSDEQTLDVRVTAALYLCQINRKKDEALCSLAEVITEVKGNSPGKGRAWANIFLLGSEAKEIGNILQTMKLAKNDGKTLSNLLLRIENQLPNH
jgi:N-sulfoglucosamine sulfohydrolase